MTDHSTKVKRAMRQSAIGDHPESVSAMLRAVPPSVIAALTGAQLAELLDAMWRLSGESKAAAERDAVDAGAIWDARRGGLREIGA